MIATKVLALLFPFMIAAQSKGEYLERPGVMHPILPGQDNAANTDTSTHKIDEKKANKLLGQNKHSYSPMGGFGPSYGGGYGNSYGAGYGGVYGGPYGGAYGGVYGGGYNGQYSGYPGGYGYGAGYGSYGGGYAYGANARGYGAYGGWDANPSTVY